MSTTHQFLIRSPEYSIRWLSLELQYTMPRFKFAQVATWKNSWCLDKKFCLWVDMSVINLFGWGVIPAQQLYIGDKATNGKDLQTLGWSKQDPEKSYLSLALSQLRSMLLSGPLIPFSCCLKLSCCLLVLLLFHLVYFLLKPQTPELLDFSFLYFYWRPVHHFSWWCLREVTVFSPLPLYLDPTSKEEKFSCAWIGEAWGHSLGLFF